MATWNGFIAELIKGSSTGGENAVLTGVSRVTTIPDAVPMKMFTNPIFAVDTQGNSGSTVVSVVCGVGGATAVFAQGTITGNGGTILGLTNPQPAGSIDVQACPRPVFVGFSTTTDLSGFTATVYMMGEYN